LLDREDSDNEFPISRLYLFEKFLDFSKQFLYLDIIIHDNFALAVSPKSGSEVRLWVQFETLIFYARITGIAAMLTVHIIRSGYKSNKQINPCKKSTDFLKLAKIRAFWWQYNFSLIIVPFVLILRFKLQEGE
jgi:hypothetical protein